MLRHLLLVLCALTLSAAANAAPACRSDGYADAHFKTFDPKDSRVMAGLATALMLGLEPADFPAANIAAVKRPCLRFPVSAGDRTLTMQGENADSPPRWLRIDANRIFYLALIPDPLQAADWADKARDKPDTPATFTSMLYAVVVAEGSRRDIYAFYDKILDNYHLQGVIGRILAGARPAASYDVVSHGADLERIATAGPNLQTDGPTKATVVPDGQLFASGADGLVTHPPSGLACPPEIAGFKRNDFLVLDARDGGRDVACRYFRADAWLTAFATFIPGASLAAVTEGYRSDAQAKAVPSGDLPVPVGVASGLPMRNLFWRSVDGSGQGMWVLKAGDWYYQLRVTFQPGAASAVAALAKALISGIEAGAPAQPNGSPIAH